MQVMWHNWLSLFVAPVCLALTLDETIRYMMLSSKHVSEHSGAKGTLISDTQEIKHVSVLMVRQI